MMQNNFIAGHKIYSESDLHTCTSFSFNRKKKSIILKQNRFENSD